MTDDVAQTLLASANARQAEMAATIRELVLCESPSTAPEFQEPVFEVLAQRLEGIGYQTERLPGTTSGGMLMAKPAGFKSDAPSQLLLGHSDTVWPVGTLQTMPFKLEGNRLSGPGTFDMKGGLTMIIFALEMLHELGQTPTVQPLVLVNSDEEIGSLDSRDTIIALAKEANRAFVLEPGKGERGSLKMVRPGVAHYRMTTRGIPAHAGLSPQSGASAILEMSHVIQKVTALRDWDRGILVNAGVVDGGSRPNVVAETCQIEVDVRANTAADAEEIHSALMAVEVEDERVTLIVEGGFNRPPMEMTKGNLAFWAITKEAGNRLGMSLEYGQVGGASDGNFTSQHCPTMDGLGPVGDGAHAYHEHLFVDKVAERTALLALLLLTPALKR